MKRAIAIIGVATILAALAIWNWVVRAPALSYGDPTKTYFNPAEGAPGETVLFCLDDVTWYRICTSELVTYFSPGKGQRIDNVYRISVPLKPGRVPPKCRAWIVPDVPPGPATMTGFARSECSPLDHWSPIVAPLPTIKFNVLPRR